MNILLIINVFSTSFILYLTFVILHSILRSGSLYALIVKIFLNTQGDIMESALYKAKAVQGSIRFISKEPTVSSAIAQESSGNESLQGLAQVSQTAITSAPWMMKVVIIEP